MALKPEDVKVWTIEELERVKSKVKTIERMPNGAMFRDLYLKFKGYLKTFPPDSRVFSVPLSDGAGLWVVHSEQKRILLVAQYSARFEVCIVKHLFLAEEVTQELFDKIIKGEEL